MKMRSLLLTLALALSFGCNKSSSTTSPSPPPPTDKAPGPTEGSAACGVPNQGSTLTPEQCTCLGGRVNGSRGGEQEHCGREELEVGAVRLGIEGGWCCKTK